MTRCKAWTAALAACCALLVSCTEPTTNPTASPAPSQSTTSASPSPSSATSAPTPTPDGIAASAIVEFWKVVDQLSANPDKSLNALHDVARGQMFDQWSVNIRQYRHDDVRQTGVVKADVQSVKATATTGVYQVRACIDVGRADLVDSKGRSTVNPGRQKRLEYEYMVQIFGGKGYLVSEAVKGSC